MTASVTDKVIIKILLARLGLHQQLLSSIASVACNRDANYVSKTVSVLCSCLFVSFGWWGLLSILCSYQCCFLRPPGQVCGHNSLQQPTAILIYCLL